MRVCAYAAAQSMCKAPKSQANALTLARRAEEVVAGEGGEWEGVSGRRRRRFDRRLLNSHDEERLTQH